nr:neuropeptide [Hymenolepis microstoma]
MSPLSLASFLTTILLLGISYSTEAYLIPFRVPENDLKPMDSSQFDDFDEIASRSKKNDITYLPKRFKTAKDMERYMAALNAYYMIFGRPRFG